MLKFRLKKSLVTVVAVLWVLTLGGEVWGEEKGNTPQLSEPLRLADLEEMALKNNPTIPQATAGVRSAEGRRLQAGLYPNPTLGYSGEEISLQEPSKRSIHSVFLEQRVVTAGKLDFSREVFTEELKQAKIAQELQKRRVLSDVRVLFYQVLGAQEFHALRKELANLTREAVEITRQLYNVGQADLPDIVEAEVQAQKAEVDQASAKNQLETAWSLLANVVGIPGLAPTRLAGALEEEAPKLDREALLSSLLRDSPQIQIAQSRIDRAQAFIREAEAHRYPDVSLRAGYTYNSEPAESQVLLGISVPLPIFDRNQGQISSAQGGLDRAREDLRRVQLVLQARLAELFNRYGNSLALVKSYQEIISKAEKSYQLILKRYRQMAASYPQVLISQRSLFQAKVDYNHSLVDFWQSYALIEGFMLTGGLEDPWVPNPGMQTSRIGMPGGSPGRWRP